MNKQIGNLRKKRELLLKQLHKTSRSMIRGSLVKIARRCHNKSCSCYSGDTKHGFMYSISIPGEKATQMVYLNQDAALSKKLASALQSFKLFWQLSKELAYLNLLIYKLSFKKERR